MKPTPSATFLIRYKQPPDSTGGTGRLTFTDSCARDFEGIEENIQEACKAVERFVNDYYGSAVVLSVELEEED